MRKLLLFKHTSRHIKQSMISTFNKTIVLRSIRSSNLMLNSIIITELMEFCRVILASTIRSENLYLLTTLLLSLHLELLEFCEHLSLKLDKCYPRHSCELIHKRHKIPISSK